MVNKLLMNITQIYPPRVAMKMNIKLYWNASMPIIFFLPLAGDEELVGKKCLNMYNAVMSLNSSH
jgi:hypothetical protein